MKQDRIDTILEKVNSIHVTLTKVEANLENHVKQVQDLKEKVARQESKLTKITYLIIGGAGALSVYHWSTVRELLRFIV